jgi:hypothetical protein
MVGSKGVLVTDPAMISSPTLRRAFVWSNAVAGHWDSIKDTEEKKRILRDTMTMQTD